MPATNRNCSQLFPTVLAGNTVRLHDLLLQAKGEGAWYIHSNILSRIKARGSGELQGLKGKKN